MLMKPYPVPGHANQKLYHLTIFCRLTLPLFHGGAGLSGGGDGRKGDPVLTYLTVLLPSNRGRLPRPTQSNSLATKFTVSGNRKMPKSSRITMECSPIRRIHSFANVAFGSSVHP
nr:hypothetical protein Iba_chr07eCG9210 [Ipomoea batatas]